VRGRPAKKVEASIQFAHRVLSISSTLYTKREQRTYKDAAKTLGRHRRTSAQKNLQLLREISGEHMRAAPRSAMNPTTCSLLLMLPIPCSFDLYKFLDAAFAALPKGLGGLKDLAPAMNLNDMFVVQSFFLKKIHPGANTCSFFTTLQATQCMRGV